MFPCYSVSCCGYQRGLLHSASSHLGTYPAFWNSQNLSLHLNIASHLSHFVRFPDQKWRQWMASHLRTTKPFLMLLHLFWRWTPTGQYVTSRLINDKAPRRGQSVFCCLQIYNGTRQPSLRAGTMSKLCALFCELTVVLVSLLILWTCLLVFLVHRSLFFSLSVRRHLFAVTFTCRIFVTPNLCLCLCFCFQWREAASASKTSPMPVKEAW